MKGVWTGVLVTFLVFLSGCTGFPSPLSMRGHRLSFLCQERRFLCSSMVTSSLEMYTLTACGITPPFLFFETICFGVTCSCSTYPLPPAVSVLTGIQFSRRGNYNCAYVVFFKHTLLW